MLAIAGMVFEVPEGLSVEETESVVEEFLNVYLLTEDALIPGGPVPIKSWVSAHYDEKVRTKGFEYKDYRARFEPEYGLTPEGRKMLDSRMQEAAEAAAAEVPVSPTSD